MKNWKLIEALQNAEASTAKAMAKTKTNTAQSVGVSACELCSFSGSFSPFVPCILETSLNRIEFVM